MTLKKISAVNLIAISVLIIALGFTTTLAIRYWNEVTTTNNVTITLGNEDQVEMNVIDISPAFKGTLVPRGYAFWKGEVDEVHFEYEISITDRELIQIMNLVVEAVNVKIGGSTVYAHLVEVTIVDEVGRKVIDFDGETARIKIIVRLLEPVDAIEAAETGKEANVDDAELAFNTIKGKEVEITLRFKIEPKQN
ncbi:MAG: hypothetical protein WCY22_02635 [Acholeplasmataceae bacterium]